MHKTKEAVERICELEKKLLCTAEAVCAGGLENVDTCEFGQLIDMIKDLADAKKNCWKGAYYKCLAEEKHEEKEKMESGEMPWYMRLFAGGPAGYDNWRYSSGRFAPTGRGHYAGYTPDPMGRATTTTDFNWGNDRMGMGDGMMHRSGYMVPYDKYQDARRHYTETRSPEDKSKMDGFAMEHMTDTIETVKDIWQDADPSLRKKMKADLSALIGEMTV